MITSKSLNLEIRKRETDRIERENHAFAKRLFDRTSNVQKRDMDLEFKQNRKYLKAIQKVTPTPNQPTSQTSQPKKMRKRHHKLEAISHNDFTATIRAV